VGLCYCVSCAIFAVSSVLYEPHLFDDAYKETRAHALGSWCFIVGSLGFGLASLYQALDLWHFRAELLFAGFSPSIVKACVSLHVLGIGNPNPDPDPNPNPNRNPNSDRQAPHTLGQSCSWWGATCTAPALTTTVTHGARTCAWCSTGREVARRWGRAWRA